MKTKMVNIHGKFRPTIAGTRYLNALLKFIHRFILCRHFVPKTRNSVLELNLLQLSGYFKVKRTC